jgi:hypothetical protein
MSVAGTSRGRLSRFEQRADVRSEAGDGSRAIFGLIQIITIPLGVAAVVEPVLRSALAG